MIFKNRKAAGNLLAEKLLKYKNENNIIFALPRGGIPVGAEVALALDAPLSILAVRKIGAIFQPELAVGAICENQPPIWNEEILTQLELTIEDLKPSVNKEIAKVNRQIVLFRNGHQLPSLKDRNVIVVDDGLATGATVKSAVLFLKTKGAAKIIVAVPVAAASSARQISEMIDELIVIQAPEDLTSIGQWYEDFEQVSDDEALSYLKETQYKTHSNYNNEELTIPVDEIRLNGILNTFPSMKALIIFVHGSGSSRHSPRNQLVAKQLNDAGFGTLLFDLLTESEAENKNNVFNIEFLSRRLIAVTQWLHRRKEIENIPIGYFGASTGAAAAIHAAAKIAKLKYVFSIVSRGGRPDLAGQSLVNISIPVLLLVGENDADVLRMNREAQSHLKASKLFIIAGATHLFEEPGALDEVSKKTIGWFNEHLKMKEVRRK